MCCAGTARYTAFSFLPLILFEQLSPTHRFGRDYQIYIAKPLMFHPSHSGHQTRGSFLWLSSNSFQRVRQHAPNFVTDFCIQSLRHRYGQPGRAHDLAAAGSCFTSHHHQRGTVQQQQQQQQQHLTVLRFFLGLRGSQAARKRQEGERPSCDASV